MQPDDPASLHASRRTPRPRRAFPVWGLVPVLLPWLWFAIRDRNGPTDVVAVGMPGIGIIALVIGVIALGTRRLVVAATAGSVFLVCGVATIGPRLPQRTEAPSPGITVVSDNVFHTSRLPGRAALVMTGRAADVIVSVEMGGSYIAHMGDYSARYPYSVVVGQQGVWSRWPVRQLATPPGLPRDRIARVEVDADGLRFVVYAVHLLNPLHETSFGEQRALLGRLESAVDAETEPAIVAGDLNLSDRSAGYRILDGSMRDAMRTDGLAPNTYQYGAWRAFLLRIDHLFVPEEWCAADASTFRVPGSDHRGIQSTIGPCPA
jgi:endonuclease/exonuclease/phosphatase (EEP) superfamily protein YafD